MATDVTDATFESEVIQSGEPVLVDFWAEWCGPCHAVAPVLEKIAEERNLKLVKVNIDENQELAVRYGIQSIPNMVLFEGGQPKASAVTTYSLSTSVANSTGSSFLVSSDDGGLDKSLARRHNAARSEAATRHRAPVSSRAAAVPASGSASTRNVLTRSATSGSSSSPPSPTTSTGSPRARSSAAIGAISARLRTSTAAVGGVPVSDRVNR